MTFFVMPAKAGIHVFLLMQEKTRGWSAFADHDKEV
jgi:hypothetical protein